MANQLEELKKRLRPIADRTIRATPTEAMVAALALYRLEENDIEWGVNKAEALIQALAT